MRRGSLRYEVMLEGDVQIENGVANNLVQQHYTAPPPLCTPLQVSKFKQLLLLSLQLYRTNDGEKIT